MYQPNLCASVDNLLPKWTITNPKRETDRRFQFLIPKISLKSTSWIFAPASIFPKWTITNPKRETDQRFKVLIPKVSLNSEKHQSDFCASVDSSKMENNEPKKRDRSTIPISNSKNISKAPIESLAPASILPNGQ